MVLEQEGVDNDVIDVVKILSKKSGESYKDFILRVCENKDAMQVKMADIKHNLSDLKKGSMKDKYELSLWIIEKHLRGVLE